MNNVFLIGMMGSGKTTTAAELAKLLGMNAVDIDDLIVECAGKSINDIFAQDGEPAFREFETKVLHEVSNHAGQVVATGGGIVLAPENVKRMRDTGKVIYLKTGFTVLWDRVKDAKDRPLLKVNNPRETFLSIHDKRVPLYERAAHNMIVTDGKTPHQAAKEINDKYFQ